MFFSMFVACLLLVHDFFPSVPQLLFAHPVHEVAWLRSSPIERGVRATFLYT